MDPKVKLNKEILKNFLGLIIKIKLKNNSESALDKLILGGRVDLLSEKVKSIEQRLNFYKLRDDISNTEVIALINKVENEIVVKQKEYDQKMDKIKFDMAEDRLDDSTINDLILDIKMLIDSL